MDLWIFKLLCTCVQYRSDARYKVCNLHTFVVEANALVRIYTEANTCLYTVNRFIQGDKHVYTRRQNTFALYLASDLYMYVCVCERCCGAHVCLCMSSFFLSCAVGAHCSYNYVHDCHIYMYTRYYVATNFSNFSKKPHNR